MPRWVTGAFLVLGGACVAFAAMAMSGRKTGTQTPKSDPLGDLLAQHAKAGTGAGTKPTDLGAADVTFPAILSDQQSPTTALAAVKGQSPSTAGKPAASTLAPVTVLSVAPTSPPPAADRLPVVPLPAQHVLEATPVITRPRDNLTKVATDAAQLNAAPASTNLAPSGHEGGYQLQVSSFRTQQEANQFSEQLRARGHKSYVVEAHVPGRGTWYRVRVGPFPSQHAAAQYRSGFETKEHVVPFIVPPASK